MQEHPTRGAVDGHEQIATRGFVWHLRQVFDVDVNKAGFVVLEGLLGRDRFSLGLGNHIFQAGHAFALEQTGNARAADRATGAVTARWPPASRSGSYAAYGRGANGLAHRPA